MAVKELSIEDRLKTLYQLQSIDSNLDEIKVLKGELPMEVSDLEDIIAGLETRKDKLTASMDELDLEIAKHKANIKEAETLIERYNAQLDNVKNNREFDALTKEIELQKLEIQLSEKKTREIQSNKEAKKEMIDNNAEKLDARNTELEAKKVELEKIIEKTEKKEVKLGKEAKKARGNIDPVLLKAYDKIRGTYRNGLALVPINRGSCGGCFNQIPPQQQIEIGMMKKIIACEHCGRVLVDDTILDQKKKK